MLTPLADKGSVAEARFLVEAFNRGWEVCKPFHHQNPYDFLVRRSPGKPWETVQCKAVRVRKGGYLSVKLLKVRNGKASRYNKGEFDYLFAATAEESWLIPWHTIENHSAEIIISSEKYLRWQLF